MALNFKSYQFTSTAAQGVNAITVTTTTALVRLIKFHNGSTSGTADVEVLLSKSGSGQKTIIKKQLNANENFDALVDMLALENGDVLRIDFGAANVSVLISYVESTTSFEGHSVAELTDWSNTAPTNGQIPVWNASAGEYVPTTSGSTISNTDELSEGSTNLYFTNARADARIAAASIDDLSDVDTTTVAPTTGQALVWDGAQWEPGTVSGGGGGGATDLDGLSDVSAPSPSNGDVIVFNTGTSTWTTSGSLQNLVALLKQPTSDTTTIEADTSNKITIDKTTSAEKVVATVDGTDAMVVKDTHTEFKGVLLENQGRLTLRELATNGTNYIGLRSPSNVTTTTTFVLPDGDGTAGQFLKTDGSSNLSWASASGGGGTNQMMIPWAFFDSTLRDVFIPITSELENTSSQRYNKFVAPFAGSLTKCTVFGTLNQSGGTGISLTISKQTGTNVYTDQETVTLSSLTAYSASTFTFSTNSFNAGDVLMFELTNGFSAAFGNLTGTLLFTAS